MEALAELGDPRVVPVLNALLEKGGEDLLWTVIQALQKFGHAEQLHRVVENS